MRTVLRLSKRPSALLSLRILCGVLLFLCLSCAAQAQPRRSAPPTPIPSAAERDARTRNVTPAPDSAAQEMLSRAAIRGEEASYKEAIERAKENAQLGAELEKSFKTDKSLSREAIKKLERMEKLARNIRSRVGGSDDADDTLEHRPPNLEAAMKQLADLSETLRNDVEKTSRHVVSASVIEHSNELIELIRLIRTLTQTQ